MNRKNLKTLARLNDKCYRQAELCSSISNIFDEYHTSGGSISDLDKSVLSSFLSKKLKNLKKIIAKIDHMIYEERK